MNDIFEYALEMYMSSGTSDTFLSWDECMQSAYYVFTGERHSADPSAQNSVGRPARPDKKVSRKRVMLRPQMWDSLEEKAAETGLTVNQLIETAVARHLELDWIIE